MLAIVALFSASVFLCSIIPNWRCSSECLTTAFLTWNCGTGKKDGTSSVNDCSTYYFVQNFAVMIEKKIATLIHTPYQTNGFDSQDKKIFWFRIQSKFYVVYKFVHYWIDHNCFTRAFDLLCDFICNFNFCLYICFRFVLLTLVMRQVLIVLEYP